MENVMKRFIILIFASFFFVSAQAEIYRWVDSEGNIQLTETPPPPEAQGEGTTVEKMEMPTSVEGEGTDEITVEEETPDAEVADTEEDETTADGETQTAAEKVVAAKRKNCEVAQSRMSTLTSKAAILKKDEEGNDMLMTDEMRQAAIAETQEYVNMYCGNSSETE